MFCLMCIIAILLVGVCDRQVVVIHAAFRTGSSFLGELFNRNLDVFYVFEPLYKVPDRLKSRVMEKLVNTCSSNYWGITERSLSFANKPQVLYHCLFTDLIVLKTIRIRSSKWITNLKLWSPVKVIQLFRDPRAVIASRLRYPVLMSGGKPFPKTSDGIKQSAKVLCDQFLNDYFSLRKSNNTEVSTITFEELARKPYTTLRSIYEFAGLPVSPDVVSWLRSVRGSSGRSSWRSTRQDYRHVLQKWEMELSADTVCDIEDSCRDFMTELQYRFVCMRTLQV